MESVLFYGPRVRLLAGRLIHWLVGHRHVVIFLKEREVALPLPLSEHFLLGSV